MQASGIPLKDISYRGGLVTFRVPAHWREEYGEDGGGSFYEDMPNSPTFRLEVITAESTPIIGPEYAERVLASISGTMGESAIEVLPNGYALARYLKAPLQRGQQLQITYWSIAQVIPPHHVRIATFSYTLLAGQERDPQIQQELQLLDAEVRSSVLWPELA